MDYTQTKDLIYKPKRFCAVESIRIIINAVLNLIYRFLKFLRRIIIYIGQNKQVYIKYAISILTLIKNMAITIKMRF